MTKKNNINILSIDNDDDNNDYSGFVKHLDEDLKRNKSRIKTEIEEMGEIYLSEIEEKKRINELKKDRLIKYILRKTKNKFTKNILKSYSYEDVKTIHDEIKTKKRNYIVEFIDFILK